jgi:hypothetical protein
MEFEKAKQCASQLLDIYEEEPALMKTEKEMYINGLFNYLISLYFCNETSLYLENLVKLEKFVSENEQSFNDNLNIRAFHILELSRFTSFFLKARFNEGINSLNEFFARNENHQNLISKNRVFNLEMNYLISTMSMGAGDFKRAIKHLNLIVNEIDNPYRVDIQAFSRIFLLIAHFELENTELLSYQLKNVERFLEKSNEDHKVHILIMKFINDNLYAPKKELTPAFENFYMNLIELMQNPHESRISHYFDLIAWVKSKISGVSMQTIIMENISLDPIRVA